MVGNRPVGAAPDAPEPAGIVVFIFDPACGQCSRGDEAFRLNAGREFVRHVVVGIERLMVASAESTSSIQCGLWIVGYSRALDLVAPGATTVAAFSTRLLEAVDLVVQEGTARADVAAVSSAVCDVCDGASQYNLSSQPTTGRPSIALYLFAVAPATYEGIASFFSDLEFSPASSTESIGDDILASKACTYPSPRPASTSVHHHRLVEKAHDVLTRAQARLFWIDSSTRRELRQKDFDAQAYAIFKKWLFSSGFAKNLSYLYTLISDRSVLPFQALMAAMWNLQCFDDEEAESGNSTCLSLDALPIPGRLTNGTQSICIQLCFTHDPQEDPSIWASEFYAIYCRASLPLRDLNGSGLLPAPRDAEPGAFLRPGPEVGLQAAENSGHFAGLMIGLAESKSVLVADIYIVKDGMESFFQTCSLQPLSPLLGCTSWLGDKGRSLDELLCKPSEVSSSEGFAGEAPCLGRFSAPVFESYIGAGVSDNEPLQDCLQIATGLSEGPSHTVSRLPTFHVGEVLDIADERKTPASASTPLDELRFADTRDHQLAQNACPELDTNDATRKELMRSLRAQVMLPRDYLGKASTCTESKLARRRDHAATSETESPGTNAVFSADVAESATFDTMQQRHSDAIEQEHGRPARSCACDVSVLCPHVEANAVPVVVDKVRGIVPRTSSDLNEETFETVVTTVCQAIELLRSSPDPVSSVVYGPPDEVQSIFSMLRALWSFLDHLTQEDCVRISPMRASSGKIKRQIVNARKALLSNSEPANTQKCISLQRRCLSSLANAYLQCILELCSLACGAAQSVNRASTPGNTAKLCRHVSKILGCVRAESCRLNEFFSGARTLDATFDGFFASCLGPDAVPSRLRDIVSELCAQNDKCPLGDASLNSCRFDDDGKPRRTTTRSERLARVDDFNCIGSDDRCSQPADSRVELAQTEWKVSVNASPRPAWFSANPADCGRTRSLHHLPSRSAHGRSVAFKPGRNKEQRRQRPLRAPITSSDGVHRGFDVTDPSQSTPVERASHLRGSSRTIRRLDSRSPIASPPRRPSFPTSSTRIPERSNVEILVLATPVRKRRSAMQQTSPFDSICKSRRRAIDAGFFLENVAGTP